MVPRVRYTHAADGVSVAYWTLGQGRPLVYLTGGPWSHLELWDIPACQRWYERLAEYRMLVRYDTRGTGLSQRDTEDHSLEANVLDLEAVVSSVGLDEFDVFAAAGAGPVAITYAAQHPEHVSRLILWCAWATTSQIVSTRFKAWLSLLDEDWELMTDTCAHLVMGWAGGEAGRHAADRLRRNITPETARAALMAMRQFDAEQCLSQISAPTLVMHRREVSWLPVDSAIQLASGISGARLTILPGESTAPFLGDADKVQDAIDEFLGGQLPTPERSLGAEQLDDDARRAPERARRVDLLTEREVEVLRLLAGGSSNKEIAAKLFLSVRTVERHIANIYNKIGGRGRANATAYALSRQLI